MDENLLKKIHSYINRIKLFSETMEKEESPDVLKTYTICIEEDLSNIKSILDEAGGLAVGVAGEAGAN